MAEAEIMKFIEIRKAMTQLLFDNAGGLFRVIGHEPQVVGARNTFGNARLVSVSYASGEFQKGASGVRGATTHDGILSIDFTVSQAAKGSVSVLRNENATALEKKDAIAEITEAGALANNSLEEVMALVWQIIKDKRNIYLGLADYSSANQWIDRIETERIFEEGGLAVRQARMFYSFRVSEAATGLTPGPPLDVVKYDTDFEINNDPVQKTGTNLEVANN